MLKRSCEKDQSLLGHSLPSAQPHALPVQVKRAVVQVISAMAHHGYLEQPGGEAMMEFLVRQCALPSDLVSTPPWGQTPPERWPGPLAGSLPLLWPAPRCWWLCRAPASRLCLSGAAVPLPVLQMSSALLCCPLPADVLGVSLLLFLLPSDALRMSPVP